MAQKEEQQVESVAQMWVGMGWDSWDFKRRENEIEERIEELINTKEE